MTDREYDLLTSSHIDLFRRHGHVTVADLLDNAMVESARQDIEQWASEFCLTLTETQRAWFVEKDGSDRSELRKLDNPAIHREFFRSLGTGPPLATLVGQLLGPGSTLFFSQVFMKPPEVGGPKPIHQDNYYFGPDDLDATLTVWVAIDTATVENGCLYYADAPRNEVAPHLAPEDEPFNLQIDPEIASNIDMIAAPVPSGGVSIHHGNTPHQSSSNRSDRPRRAVAFHYLRSGARLLRPALPYDDSLRLTLP